MAGTSQHHIKGILGWTQNAMAVDYNAKIMAVHLRWLNIQHVICCLEWKYIPFNHVLQRRPQWGPNDGIFVPVFVLLLFLCQGSGVTSFKLISFLLDSWNLPYNAARSGGDKVATSARTKGTRTSSSPRIATASPHTSQAFTSEWKVKGWQNVALVARSTCLRQ